MTTPAIQSALLEGLFARVPEAIALLDTDDRILQVNPEFTRIFGYAREEACGRLINDLLVPKELMAEGEEYTRRGLRGESLNVETVRKHKDGTRIDVSMISGPVTVAGSQVSEYVIYRDITERKHAEQALQRTQFYLSEGQRVAHLGSWAFNAAGFDYWSSELFQVHGLDPRGQPPTLEDYLNLVHPEDRGFMQQGIQKMLADHLGFDFTKRIVRPDGEIRHVRWVGVPMGDRATFQGFVGTAMDVTEQEQLMGKLRQSEEELRTITDTIRQPIVVLAPDGTTLYANRVALDNSGLTIGDATKEGFLARVCHPDDVDRVRDERHAGLLKGTPFDLEMRVFFKNGQYRWQLIQYNPLKDERGQIIRWYITATDIDDRKRAEEKLQQSEQELRTITDTIRQPIVVLAPDGSPLYANQVAFDFSGLTVEEVDAKGFLDRACHPDELERVRDQRRTGMLEGAPFELEMRFLFKRTQYRWMLMQYNPLKDEQGKIIRWYATATDIDDRKRAEERLRNENVKLAQERVYLEEQIRSEMGYEQIIGNSPTLRHVLEMVETVAPSDSTVLLLGETGTGKELIARAVHERSRRKAKTFVKLNCAAIPTGLLESELFGHEKGAFTGAIIQKVGRMELADQGTLFLDEVGDIPIDIQPKLLRALQEKEFERLGSTHTRKVNMRLVAATNRNLEKMVADREFRNDLFYRLNVFPIRIPPLRDRKDDIPLLVAYFVQKFAKQMQKRIESIPVATMKALAAWEWPGNIRELENFIERAVILTHGEALAAPLSELRKMTTDEPAGEPAPETETDIARIVKETIASMKGKGAENERTQKQHEEIVRALTESKGRVGGADGAAVRMGLSRTTLISRMKKLGISPYDYE